MASHASAFTQGNDLPWNPAKHSSVLKVLNKLPEVYHIRRGLSSKAVGPFIPGLKARGFLAPFCKFKAAWTGNWVVTLDRGGINSSGILARGIQAAM